MASVLQILYMEIFLEYNYSFLCKRIVPCSPVVIPRLIANIPVIENKLHIINGFLDTSNLKPNHNLGASLKSQFPDGYFLYIGSLDKNKSVDRIMESYKIYCTIAKNQKMYCHY